MIFIKAIIDRFDENIAIVELDEEIFGIIKKSALPKSSKEGDAIIRHNKKWKLDKKSTAELKKQVHDLVNDLFI